MVSVAVFTPWILSPSLGNGFHLYPSHLCLPIFSQQYLRGCAPVASTVIVTVVPRKTSKSLGCVMILGCSERNYKDIASIIDRHCSARGLCTFIIANLQSICTCCVSVVSDESNIIYSPSLRVTGSDVTLPLLLTRHRNFPSSDFWTLSMVSVAVPTPWILSPSLGNGFHILPPCSPSQ